jgi:hypothetical protein
VTAFDRIVENALRLGVGELLHPAFYCLQRASESSWYAKKFDSKLILQFKKFIHVLQQKLNIF